jgi:hypothetical protein
VLKNRNRAVLAAKYTRSRVSMTPFRNPTICQGGDMYCSTFAAAEVLSRATRQRKNNPISTTKLMIAEPICTRVRDEQNNPMARNYAASR